MFEVSTFEDTQYRTIEFVLIGFFAIMAIFLFFFSFIMPTGILVGLICLYAIYFIVNQKKKNVQIHNEAEQDLQLFRKNMNS